MSDSIDYARRITDVRDHDSMKEALDDDERASDFMANTGRAALDVTEAATEVAKERRGEGSWKALDAALAAWRTAVEEHRERSGMSEETTEGRIERRLAELFVEGVVSSNDYDHGAIACVMAEEIERLRKEMQDHYLAHHANPSEKHIARTRARKRQASSRGAGPWEPDGPGSGNR